MRKRERVCVCVCVTGVIVQRSDLSLNTQNGTLYKSPSSVVVVVVVVVVVAAMCCVQRQPVPKNRTTEWIHRSLKSKHGKL